MKVNREKIINNIERTFAYLGCANIDTSSMDGAIPLDAIATGSSDDSIGLLKVNPIVTGLPIGWSIKATHVSGDDLVLMTCSDVHWSSLSKVWSEALSHQRMFGKSVQHPDFDCYSQLHYSRIDKFGKFRKYTLRKKQDIGIEGVQATRLFNPAAIVAYKQDLCVCLGVDWTGMDEELGVSRGYGLIRTAMMLAGVCNGMRFHWYAKVKVSPDIPSISLITDPTGVKELWKLRDIPSGKKRRQSLLHWVSEHWRANRTDPEMESYVRRQLRGHTKFTHGDFSVDIHISESDSLEIESLKEDRKLMRKKKTDLRNRNKLLKGKLK